MTSHCLPRFLRKLCDVVPLGILRSPLISCGLLPIPPPDRKALPSHPRFQSLGAMKHPQAFSVSLVVSSSSMIEVRTTKKPQAALMESLGEEPSFPQKSNWIVKNETRANTGTKVEEKSRNFKQMRTPDHRASRETTRVRSGAISPLLREAVSFVRRREDPWGTFGTSLSRNTFSKS